MNKQNIPQYIMAVIGFALILINAIGYLFDLGIKNPALVVMGLVFVIIGMGRVHGNVLPK